MAPFVCERALSLHESPLKRNPPMANCFSTSGSRALRNNRLGVFLGLGQGNSGRQLQINQTDQTSIELKELRGLLAGDDFLKEGYVLHSKLDDRFINIKGLFRQVNGLRVGQRVVALRIL